MKEVMVLRELEQIKAISNPYRIEVIESFEEERATAKTIADKMGEPHAKVNYHIKALLNVGVLELVEEKIRLGIVEKFYRPSAKAFVVDRCIFNGNEKSVNDLEEGHCLNAFEGVSKNFYRAIETYEDINIKTNYFQCNDCYLTNDEVDKLHKRIRESIEEFIECRKEKLLDESKLYSVSTFTVPK